jgi:hypothetical protein
MEREGLAEGLREAEEELDGERLAEGLNEAEGDKLAELDELGERLADAVDVSPITPNQE